MVYVYLQKLKYAKSIEDRLLIHADWLKMLTERYGARVKTADETTAVINNLLGGIIQMFRFNQHLGEMADKPTTETLTVEQRAIEQRLTDKKRLTDKRKRRR